MKKVVGMFFFLLLVASALATDNLYQYDSLDLILKVRGGFTLNPQSNQAKLKEVKASLQLYPPDDYRQKILQWESTGEVSKNQVNFVWNDEEIEEKEFSYQALIHTENERLKVPKKITFPFVDLTGYEEYLLPTKTIDSDNPQIIAKATELAEGETDSFKVAFKLASWVEENVQYDLNTLTVKASQKASWVLENRQGACDEMTSLFVAMARSLGVPARFISGISHTTSNLFTKNWQPHGWAEVYFPEIGWVSFDITFGEYGYVDVTHIKLKESFDPADPVTRYDWVAEKVDLQAQELNLDVIIKNKGKIVPEEIRLEQEILSPEVGLGSYNLVKGIVKNTADYYAATTLQLAVPSEINVEGRNKRTILLGPKEVKETYWVIKVGDDLDDSYWYNFPMVIYSEKNVSVSDEFVVQSGKSFFTREDIEKLIVKDEEKTYSRKVSLTCDYKKEIPLQETFTARCTLKNSGNTNLEKINFCLDKVCELADLAINQEKPSEIKIKGEKAGWNKIIVSAENNDIEKKMALEYVVWDEPQLTIDIDSPAEINFGEDLVVNFNLQKESFSFPEEVNLVWKSAGLENTWTIERVSEPESVSLILPSDKMSSNNFFTLESSWKDSTGKVFSKKQELEVKVKAKSFNEKLRLWFNALMKVFY